MYKNRRDVIKFLINSTAYLIFANSCKKVENFGLEDTGDNTSKINAIFDDAIRNNTIRDKSFLVKEIFYNVPLNNPFLEDKFQSRYCDEFHIYGYIMKINAGHNYPYIKNKGINKLIVTSKGEDYLVNLYDHLQVVKMAVREESIKGALVPNSSSRKKPRYKTSDWFENYLIK
jgi:hypothetical protein